MPRAATKRELSLRWLDLFQICAQKGSLQAAAKETGLTVSTVSHHLRSLEDHLGIELFNHARRPMVLTPKGRVFLRGIDEALFMIRKAKAEASAGTLAEASLLRIGTIEDFDSDIIPEIAVYLSKSMPGCHFTYQTDSSHTIIEMLRNGHLDLGIASAPHEHFRDLQDRPILRDPFVVVLPRVAQRPLKDIVEGQGNLPFLRFSAELLIAKQFGSQMRRLGLDDHAAPVIRARKEISVKTRDAQIPRQRLLAHIVDHCDPRLFQVGAGPGRCQAAQPDLPIRDFRTDPR